MNWMLFAVACLLTGLFWVQYRAWRHARRTIGEPAPDTTALDGPAGDDPLRVYFFHAEHCGPCRAVAPLVYRLGQTHRNLIAVDVKLWPTLARDFAIAATPSFVVVENGRISDVRLGGQSECTLHKLLRTKTGSGV